MDDAPHRGDWAICCSGGGIRSATYCLGALQELDERGLIDEAGWILGVSGGSYIAASRALVAHNLQGGRQSIAAGQPGSKASGNGHAAGQDKTAGNGQAAAGSGEAHRRAYARGTPEEDNLRNNTRYIAPDAKTLFVGILSLLLGAFAAFVMVAAPLYAFGHLWGWLLHWRGALTWPAHGTAEVPVSLSAWGWWAMGAATVAALMIGLFFRWWFTLPAGSPFRGSRRARWVGWAAAASAGLGVLMFAVPPAISWLYTSKGAVGTIVHFFGFGEPGNFSLASLAGLIAAVTAVAQYCQRKFAKLKLTPGVAGSAAGPVAGVVPLIRGKIMPWLTSAVIIAVGAAITLLWVGDGARTGYTTGQLWYVLGALGIMLATRALVDVNRVSLHDFYRWRLADAYAVTREAATEADPVKQRRLFAEAAKTRLSDLRSSQGPQLVIGATANINANREVAPGRGGFCLAFDPEHVTLRGDQLNGEHEVAVETTEYEHLLGRTRFTLFDVVAMSGAAFSPLMGAMTRSAYRILLTMTNMRLGIWMPHPRVVDDARKYLRGCDADTRQADTAHSEHHAGAEVKPERKVRWWENKPLLLLLWYVCPHPFWNRDPDTMQRRETRMWAHVLRLREQSTENPHGENDNTESVIQKWARRRARLTAALCWRMIQPTLGLLWAESAGHTSYRSTWINVTDGGHYDNLGLVEALRRGAKKIVVLDASGDRTDTWFTLGGAMGLARVDAGVDIDLDPTRMAFPEGSAKPDPALCSGEVLRPWAKGKFTQAGTAESADGEPPGNIWVCKLGWWKDAPWTVRAYAAGHKTFPTDSTAEQLYDSSEFDAYHLLGGSAVAAAAKEGGLGVPLSGAEPELTKSGVAQSA